MRVTYIAAGAGGMHCGACRRDVNVVRGLAKLGCDVQLIPLYTPLPFGDDEPAARTRTFYGGINVWLQQQSALFRRTPRWIDRLLDSRPLLRLAARVGIKTRPEELGPMTVSVLRGEHGLQRKELERLLAFIESGLRPDIVHLTNSLLSGIAPALKERLPVPVACSLQGEDDFAEAMPEPYRSQARDVMRANARELDLLISPSEAYVPKIAAFLDVPPERIQVVPTGIDADAFALAPPRPAGPFTIGYLSRITPGKGLDLLVDAVRILITEQERDVRLHIAGQVLDIRFWRAIRRTARRAGIGPKLQYAEVRDHSEKVTFLHGCTVFCLPSRRAEVRGTAVLEAMAAGVPVVVPDHGVFPELSRRASGAALFPPGDAASLAARLGELMDDPDRAALLGLAGRDGIDLHHKSGKMSERTLALYSGLSRKEKK